MTRREFVGGATVTTLSTGLSAGATTINISDGTGWPTGGTGPFAIDIDYENSKYEKVICASRSGNVLTVSVVGDRGYDDTTDTSHDSGATVRHVVTSIDLDEANAHINNVGATKHTGAAIADDAIDSNHYAAGSIDSEHFASGAVNDAALAGSGLDISKFTVGESSQDTTGNAATATLATTATNSTNINLTDESSDTSCFPLFATAATGNLPAKTDASTLKYNANTGQLSATSFVGDLTGDVTGDVTGNATTSTSAGKWTTARSIAFSGGDVTGTIPAFDGSANVTNVSLTVGNDSHSHTAATISGLDAADIGSGTFQAGNFTFQADVTAGSNFIAPTTNPPSFTFSGASTSGLGYSGGDVVLYSGGSSKIWVDGGASSGGIHFKPDNPGGPADPGASYGNLYVLYMHTNGQIYRHNTTGEAQLKP